MNTAKLTALAEELEALAGTKKLESQHMAESDPRQQDVKMQFLLLARWAKTIRDAIKP
jgi:hypothetical protein